MRSIRSLLWGLAAASSLFAGSAAAQVNHRAYLDLDSNTATGCTVATPAGNVAGVEVRLTATVSGQPPMVTAVTREQCIGAGFGAPQAQAAGYPVGVNIGTGGSDVVEFATSLSGLGPGGPATITFVSQTGQGADIVVANGVVLPGQAAVPTQPAIIPATGLLALLLLIAAVFWLVRKHPRFGSSMALLLLFGAGVAWAANFVTDGQIGDWVGVQPRATDANNDATSGEMTIEIVAVFAETEGGNLFLRVDVRDAQNQPPVANVPAAVVLNEDGSVTITLTGTDPENAPLTFAIATNPTRGTLGAITPINATSASVLYTASANQNGADSFTFTVNDGSSSSAPATVSITITAVNDAPVVNAATFTTVENAGNGTVVGTATATEVDTGQTLIWSITAGNTGGAFAINPATGQITVANSAAVVGTSFSLTVQALDNSGAPNASGSATITVTITGVNDEPSFTAGPNQNATEDDPAVTVVGWATNILAGPPDEAGQTLTFNVSNNNNALFAVQPTIAANGTLTYQLAPNANGTATVSVFLQDNGGTAGGGDDTSPTVTFTITVAAVNDTPSFALPASPDQNVLQNSGAATVPGFATAISAGPSDESAQTLTFNVSNDNNALFQVQPTIAANGTLSFTPAAGQIGTATVTVTLSDNGVPVATSAAQTFVINVSDVNDAPAFTVPANAPAVNEDAGATVVAGFATGVTDSDPTVQTLTFNVTGNSNPGLFQGAVTLAVNGAVGDLSYTPAANASGTATITVTLSDNGGTANGGVDTSAPQNFVITVNAVNDAPTFTSPAAFSVPEDTTAAGTVVATDVEASPIAYSISGGADAALFSINAATGALSFNAAPNFEAPADAGANNVYDVVVTASDGTNTPTQAITVTVTNVNETPVITSGNTVNVPENTTAVTTVTSTDGDGDTVTYALVGGADQARFSINAATGALTFNVAPNFEAPTDSDTNNTYVVAVSASDGVATTAQTITVTVTAVDEAPVFSSPAAFNVVEDTTPVGTAVAADPEGNAVTYALGGTDAAFFSINATTGAIAFLVAPDFEAPADAGGNNVYDITITANDGAVNGLQVVTVTVTNTNGTPSFTSSATPSVPENSTAVITVTTTDPDGDTITYSIMGGADAALFTINASTGALSFLAAPNFEAPGDAGADNVYNVTVAANDGTAAPTQALVITVTDVNEAPTFTSSNAFSVPEDTTPVGTVTTTDPEGNAVTYSITGGADMGAFSINATTGALSFNAAPNFEAPADVGGNNVYNVIVTASDGSNSPTQAIAVTLTNTNDAPVFTSSATPSAAENQTTAVTLTATDGDGDTLTFTIFGGADQALFSVVGGVLTFNSAPNFEAPADAGANNVYDVIVNVTDGTANVQQAIAVTVTNVNEAPAITSANAFSVPENSTAVATVTSTDPEAQAITYSITAGSDQALFSINATTGALTFNAAPDFELPGDVGGNNIYDVQVTASDGTNSTAQNIAVTVTNVNEGPTFTSANTANFAENGVGTAATATATDTEGDPITFAIVGGADAADFSINASTGAITFNVTPDFEAPHDADTNNTYVVDLTATSTGGSANQTLTITVTNVNETPVITSGAPANVPENTAGTFHTVTATDPDGTTPTYAISGGADAADFAINATTGALSFAVAPNFEAPADADTNNVYVVTVRATDGTLFDDETYNVTVTDVNEAPVIVADAAFNYVGNTELRIAGHAGVPTALAATTDPTNPKANDTDPDTNPAFNTLTYVVVTNGTTASGGSYDVAADGTVRFTPAAGDVDGDTAAYQLTDGTNVVNGNLTFTFTGTDVVWYVENNDDVADGTPTRDGTSSFPFNTLAAAGTASLANHIIYVDNGDGTASNQNAGIVLKNNQKLIGNGVPLVVNVSTNLIAAGAQPQIGNTGGFGVSAPNLTGNVVVRGLNIAGSTDAVNATYTGATSGNLEVGDNTIRSATNQGIEVAAGSTGAVNVAVHDNNVTSTQEAIELAETAGTLTITAFDDNVISGNSGSHGIDITNATFDTVAGVPFAAVSGGVTAVGQSGNGVGNIGIRLANVLGDLSFTSLNIFNSNGAGLQVTSAGVFNAAGGTGFRLVNNSNADSIVSNGGPAVNVANTTLTLNPTLLTVTGSGTFGVNLDAVAGTFSAAAGSSIASPTAAGGTAFRINASSVNSTYNGTINATQGRGVQLVGNSGTYLFTGALTLSTGVNPAFEATGGGTVSSSNTSSTLATTTAIALNVANTNIGAADLRFQSISANGASSGIVLNTTGAAGELIVSGTGAASSGGTIQATTSHGISLVSTTAPSFTSMLIQNTGGSGVNGTGVAGFSFVNGTISGSGNALGESNISFNGNGTGLGANFSGAFTLTGSTLNTAFDCGVHIAGDVGTISNAVIQNNSFTSSTAIAASQGDAIRLVGTGNASTVSSLTQATISGNTIRNFPGGGGIQVNYGNSNTSGPAGFAGSGGNSITITGNSIRGETAANRMNTSAILYAVSGGSGGQRSGGLAVISNNGTGADPLGNNTGSTIGIGINGFATVTGTIGTNVMASNNALGSNGVSGGSGVVLGCAVSAANCETPDATITTTNNNISATDGNGILLVGRGNLGNTKLGIRTNTVAAPLGGTRPGIRVDAGNASANSDDLICLDLSGNTTGGSGGHEGIGLRKQGTVSTTHDFGVEGMAATASPGVETYVGNTGLNPGAANGSFGTTGVLLLSGASGFSNCSTAP
jgi:VCBS repeat-containing protein